MKILMVAEDFPWPSLGRGLSGWPRWSKPFPLSPKRTSSRIYDPSRTTPALPLSLDIRRWEAVQYPAVLNSELVAVVDAATGDAKEVFMRSYDPLPRTVSREVSYSDDVRPRLVQHGGNILLDGSAPARSHHRRSHGPGRCEGSSGVFAPAKRALSGWAETGRGSERPGSVEPG